MKRLVLLVVLVLLASCARKSPQELYQAGRAAEGKGDLAAAAAAYKEAVGFTTESAYAESCQYRLANMYLFPDGDKRLAAAEQARFHRLFPASPNAPAMLFLAAFTYNNDLHELDSARKLYTAFLDRYPNDKLAGSARFELENIGRSAEEFLRSRQDDSLKALPQ